MCTCTHGCCCDCHTHVVSNNARRVHLHPKHCGDCRAMHCSLHHSANRASSSSCLTIVLPTKSGLQFGFNNGKTMVDGLDGEPTPSWEGGDFATIVQTLKLLGFNAVRLPFQFTDLLDKAPMVGFSWCCYAFYNSKLCWAYHSRCWPERLQWSCCGPRTVTMHTLLTARAYRHGAEQKLKPPCMACITGTCSTGRQARYPVLPLLALLSSPG